MALGSSATYSIPTYDWYNYIDTSPPNNFVTLSGMTYNINPPLYSFENLLSIFTVTYDAMGYDSEGGSYLISSHSFTVDVTNTAPTYVSTPAYTTYPGESTNYPLPATHDAEGHAVTLTVGASPASFINWNSGNNGFDILPPTQANVGSYPITLDISDGDLVSNYVLIIKVDNRPP